MTSASIFTTKTVSLTTRDIGPQILDSQGRLKVMPAAFYRETTDDERRLACSKYGLYCLPTTELIEWLTAFIAGRSALEIGAGNGSICRALRIRGSDNFMQERSDIAAYYQSVGASPVRYSRQLEKLDANSAVRRHKPKVVVAAWVTHKYDPAEHERGGNQWGVDEQDIIENCDAYVFVGNRHTHRHKPIWSLPHEAIEPDWLFSRRMTDDPEFIAVWERSKIAAAA